MSFRRQVAAKKTTWEKLIKAGMVLPRYEFKGSPAREAVKKLSKPSK